MNMRSVWPTFVHILTFLGDWTFCCRILCGEEQSLVEGNSKILEMTTRLEYARVLSYDKQYDSAIEQYQYLLKENPEFLDARIELGKIYYYQGNYPLAIQTFQGISAESLTLELQSLLGDIYRSSHEYEKAEAIYRQVLALEADDEVKFKLAEMLSWQKRYDDSIALYRELVAKHPTDIQLRRKYAMVLSWSGRRSEAAEELKKTLD